MTTRLPKGLIGPAREYADKRGITMSELVRAAVAAYIGVRYGFRGHGRRRRGRPRGDVLT